MDGACRFILTCNGVADVYASTFLNTLADCAAASVYYSILVIYATSAFPIR